MARKSSKFLTNDNRQWYRDVYLKSEHWAKLRAKKLSENPICELCGSPRRVEPHHKEYRNIFDVSTADLVSVCRKCHKAIHREIDASKKVKHAREKIGELKSLVIASLDLSHGFYPFMQNKARIPVITPKILQGKFLQERLLVESEFGACASSLIGRGLPREVIDRLGLNVRKHRGQSKSLMDMAEEVRKAILGDNCPSQKSCNKTKIARKQAMASRRLCTSLNPTPSI